LESKVKVIAYTDGSCWNTKRTHPKANIGGVGGIISINNGSTLEWIEISEGKFLQTDSARMEVRAVIRVLEIAPIKSSIEIWVDATYVSDTMKSYWFQNFKESTISKYNIKNPDLWIHVKRWYQYHLSNGSTIKVEWVRGHDNHPLNEKAHELANKARLNGEHQILCRKVNTK
jgi:ribonuclease HI